MHHGSRVHKQKMEKHSGITKNKTYIQNLKREKLFQGGCQETYSNIKETLGISDKYWLFSACDNIFLIFLTCLVCWVGWLGGNRTEAWFKHPKICVMSDEINSQDMLHHASPKSPDQSITISMVQHAARTFIF